MAEMFDVAELVRVAVEDERSGVAFYGALAGRAGRAELKKVFAELCEEEKRHQKRFEEMLAGLGDHKPPERYGGEYAGYLHALTTDRAFPDEAAALEAAAACGDDAAAVDLASRFERDTLILMQEMRKLVPARHQQVVDELADEERSHLVKLSEARKALGG